MVHSALSRREAGQIDNMRSKTQSQRIDPHLPSARMKTDAEKLAAFFDLLAKRWQEHEAEKAQERKDEQYKKLAKLQP